MFSYFTDANAPLPSSKAETPIILLICDHQILGKAIESGLKSVGTVDTLYTNTEPISKADMTKRIERAQLVIFSLLGLGDNNNNPSVDTIIKATGWSGAPPVLLISEEPVLNTQGKAEMHYLRFPFDMAKLQQRVSEILADSDTSAQSDAPTQSETRVLVVEDESIVAMDLRSTLQRLGYKVLATLAFAEKAVEFVEDNSPDVILMDIHLRGEMDGIEAARSIMSKTDIPVVFLTAHSDSATLGRAQETAPYGYILKPFDERELESAIRVALYRAKSERSIRARERWLSTILHASGDGIIATDAQGRVAFLNPVAESLIDLRWDDILNRPLDEVVKLDSAVDAESEASEVDAPQREIIQIPHGDGIRIVDQTRAPIHNERGEFWGEIRALRDVTKDAEQRELLQCQTEELKAQNEELKAFAHTVAHDIKDPLHVIRGYAELLGSDDIPLDAATQKESLDIIVGYTKRITNIVGELLLLSTVRESDVKSQPISMGKVITKASERLSYVINRSGANVINTINEWPVGMGYAPWVEEIWVNYLSNAIKYGGKPPVIEVGADQLDDEIRYWVRDNGAGISPEDQEKLFVPFSRLHQVRATGQGLGLSIVRRIVTRLGGEVGVESQVGKGSTFFFTLPMAPEPTRETVEQV